MLHLYLHTFLDVCVAPEQPEENIIHFAGNRPDWFIVFGHLTTIAATAIMHSIY